jgi:hypothetical protein
MKAHNALPALTELSEQPIHLQKHFSPEEVAEMWGCSPNTIRRMFAGHPQVLEYGSPETRFKRKRVIMRIPESLLIRVHAQKPQRK